MQLSRLYNFLMTGTRSESGQQRQSGVENVIVAPRLVAMIDRAIWGTKGDGPECRFNAVYAPGADFHDAAGMLEIFLRLDATDKNQVVNFLHTYGDFRPVLRPLTLKEFAEWQTTLRHMRLNAPSRWEQCPPVNPLQNLEFQMGWYGNIPEWRLQSMGCLHAMAAVIHLDRAKGLRFGRCPVCREIFPKQTRHKQTYCGRTCQHRKVVRAASRRARKTRRRLANSA